MNIGLKAIDAKYNVPACRECGLPIAIGEKIWWAPPGAGPRIHGTIRTPVAHLGCGWTAYNGKVHPQTTAYIQDVDTSLVVVPKKVEPIYDGMRRIVPTKRGNPAKAGQGKQNG